MIVIDKGNIFESSCEAWTNPVNCRGIAGAGLAGAFARRYPMMLPSYKEACVKGNLQLGTVHVWDVEQARSKGQSVTPDGLRYIINVPTMYHPGEIAEEFTIVSGLNALVEAVIEKQIKSISVCALGCGIGMFSWDRCRQLIEEFSKQIPDTLVEAYSPQQ